MSSNKIAALDKTISALTALTTLDLSNNKIENLPDEFCILKMLMRVNLNANPLKKLPNEFGKLSALETLTVSQTHLSKLPQSFADLQLSSLVANGTPLKTIPPEILNIESLNSLSLRKCKIRSALPPEINNLVCLKSLDISLNYFSQVSLSDLPPSLASLNAKSNKIDCLYGGGADLNLEELNLSSNKLTSLPADIGQLKNLRELNLSTNNIKSVPTQLFELVSLIKLDLGKNSLQELPANIKSLINLQDINLYGNNISHLPEEIGYLSNLRSLNLVGNDLEKLPASLGNLSRLRNLAVRKNCLMNVPLELANLTKLENLQIDENPLEQIPAIKGMGLKSIFEYLTTLANQDSIVYTVLLEDEIKVPFKQFVRVFGDFVKTTKNRTINMEVNDVPDGITVKFNLTLGVSKSDIERYFNEYADFLSKAAGEWVLNIENAAAPNSLVLTRLMLSIRNSINFLADNLLLNKEESKKIIAGADTTGARKMEIITSSLDRLLKEKKNEKPRLLVNSKDDKMLKLEAVKPEIHNYYFKDVHNYHLGNIEANKSAIAIGTGVTATFINNYESNKAEIEEALREFKELLPKEIQKNAGELNDALKDKKEEEARGVWATFKGLINKADKTIKVGEKIIKLPDRALTLYQNLEGWLEAGLNCF